MATPALPLDFQALFQHLPDNFLVLAPDDTILSNTDRHAAASLLPRAEVVGRNVFEAYPASADSQQALRASLDYVRQHRQPHTMPVTRYDLERPAALGGGTEERHWQITHYPLLDAHGELQYILQRSQDVTHSYQAAQRETEMQRQLAESQNQARFVLEALPVLIWASHPDGSISTFNRRWLAYTGRNEAESVGWGWTQDLDPDQRAEVTRRWQTAAAAGEEFQLEFRLRRADGQYRWLLGRCVPHRTAEGTISQWVGGATDIHEQKELVQDLLLANEQQAAMAELAYEAQRDALSQRATFYHLFQQAPALIAILRGPGHVFDFANPEYQALFPGRALMGHAVAEVMPELVGQGFVALLDQVYTSGTPFIGKAIPVTLHAPDGSGTTRPGFFDFTYQVFHESGHKAGITVFAYDVTELVTARQALERLRDEPDAR